MKYRVVQIEQSIMRRNDAGTPVHVMVVTDGRTWPPHKTADENIATRDAEIGWPRVAASFEFKKPLQFEDEFDVHLKVAEKTRKTIRYSAVLRKDGEEIAAGSLTIICVRRRPGERARAMDMPLAIAARFQVAD